MNTPGLSLFIFPWFKATMGSVKLIITSLVSLVSLKQFQNHSGEMPLSWFKNKLCMVELEYYGLPRLVALTLIVRLRLLYESETGLIMLKILLELTDIWDETSTATTSGIRDLPPLVPLKLWLIAFSMLSHAFSFKSSGQVKLNETQDICQDLRGGSKRMKLNDKKEFDLNVEKYYFLSLFFKFWIKIVWNQFTFEGVCK